MEPSPKGGKRGRKKGRISTDKVFLAFGEDLRRTLDEAEFVERNGRRSVRLRGRSPVLRELTDRVHKEILELIV